MRTSQRLFIPVLAAAAIGASGFAALQHPGERRKDWPLLAGADIDRGTLGIIERACQDCHSERTRWPWYSHIPPVSWLLQRDVMQARSHLDLSRWQDYSAGERRTLLSTIGAATRSETMPPGRYTVLHAEGRLSRAEREQVYRWTRAERSRIAGPPHSPAKTRQTIHFAGSAGDWQPRVEMTQGACMPLPHRLVGGSPELARCLPLRGRPKLTNASPPAIAERALRSQLHSAHALCAQTFRTETKVANRSPARFYPCPAHAPVRCFQVSSLARIGQYASNRAVSNSLHSR